MSDFSPTELLMLGLLAVNLIVGLLLVIFRGGRSGHDRKAARIAAEIKDYFRRSGVEVAVDCASLDGGKHYTAFIESEPMKRWRLSHIIEATLAEHVQKACKLELEKIYWRFPIKEGVLRAEPDERTEQAASAPSRSATPTRTAAAAPASARPAAAPAAAASPLAPATPAKVEHDDYISEGLHHYKHLPKVEAEEVSWETFQQMAKDPQKKQ